MSRVGRYVVFCLIYAAFVAVTSAGQVTSYAFAAISIVGMACITLPLKALFGYTLPLGSAGAVQAGAMAFAVMAIAAVKEASGGGKWIARLGLLLAMLAISFALGPTGVGR